MTFILSVAQEFVQRFIKSVSALKWGLPWESGVVTPLPEPKKPQYLHDLMADAMANT